MLKGDGAWEFSFVFDLQKRLESWSCKAVSLPSPKESQKMKDIEMTMMPKMPKWVKAQAICDTLALWQWPPVTSSSEMIEANESEIYMNLLTQQWNHTSFHAFNIFCSTAKADETTGAQPEKCRSHPTHSCATKSSGSLFIFVKVTNQEKQNSDTFFSVHRFPYLPPCSELLSFRQQVPVMFQPQDASGNLNEGRFL